MCMGLRPRGNKSSLHEYQTSIESNNVLLARYPGCFFEGQMLSRNHFNVTLSF